MISSFFNVVVFVLSCVEGIRAAPSFATNPRIWYSSRGGGLQIPVHSPIHLQWQSHANQLLIVCLDNSTR